MKNTSFKKAEVVEASSHKREEALEDSIFMKVEVTEA